jgi:hypothetical protein
MTSPTPKTSRDQMAPGDEVPGDDRLMPDAERIAPDDDPIILDEQYAVDDDQIVLDKDDAPADAGVAGSPGAPGDVRPGEVTDPPPGAIQADPAAEPRPGAGSATVITDLPPGAGQASPDTATRSGQGTAPASADGPPTGAATGPAGGVSPAGSSVSPSSRWPEIQAMFVDDPRASVELAAGLTDDSIEALIGSLKERQHALLGSWQDSAAGTEELRTALRGYRSFWKRLEDFSSQS